MNGALLELRDDFEVEALNDGGMGSFLIHVTSHQAVNGPAKFVADLQVRDADDVLVIASLYVDAEGFLREVDIWKTNFEPVVQLPIVD